VDFAGGSGTATSGSDYTALVSGTLTFAPGETSKTINVDVIGDETVEQSETVVVLLSKPTNAVIDSGTATGTILDDDVTLQGKHKASFTDVDGEASNSQGETRGHSRCRILPSCHRAVARSWRSLISAGKVSLRTPS
jgi:hypothetical protein